MTDGKLSVTFILMSIMVYPFMNERVNHYTVNFGNMFTLPVTYGKMFLNGKRLW